MVELDPEPGAELLYPDTYAVRFLWYSERPLIVNEIVAGSFRLG